MAVPTHGWSRGPQMLGCTAQDIVEPEARAAFVWILGEYGQNIQVLPVTCPVAVHHQLSLFARPVNGQCFFRQMTGPCMAFAAL